MVEIKAGPELDKAVADAVGAKHRGDAMVGERYGPVYELDGKLFSRPSTDLNAAFAAAEAAGLFKECLLHHDGEWHVIEMRPGDSRGESIGIGSTPALAICAAILALKGPQ